MDPLMTSFFLRIYDECEFLCLCLREWHETKVDRKAFLQTLTYIIHYGIDGGSNLHGVSVPSSARMHRSARRTAKQLAYSASASCQRPGVSGAPLLLRSRAAPAGKPGRRGRALCQRPWPPGARRPPAAGVVEATIVQRGRQSVFSFRRDSGGARLNAPELLGEASGRFPLFVQPLLERINQALLRDGQQQNHSRVLLYH